MTNKEFLDEFNILYNSIASNEAPSLDEYEISVLLTTAQEELVEELYTGKTTGESFERTEELTRSLGKLVKTDITIFEEENTVNSINLSNDVMYIIREYAEFTEPYSCSTNADISVIPVRQDEWNRIKNNPFKRPNDRKIVRLNGDDNSSIIISKYPLKSYTMIYIRKPNPIVLVPLYEVGENLSINSISDETSCELPEILHRPILNKAVQLATAIMIKK